jgi:hypothetical protein
MSTDDEQPEREPIPRALREEFDGLKPHRPHSYESPEERREHARKASLTRWGAPVSRLSKRARESPIGREWDAVKGQGT